MSRLEPYLGTVLALLFGVFLAAYFTSAPPPKIAPVAARTASSTLSVVEGLTVPSLPASLLGSDASTTQSSTTPAPKKVPQPTTQKVSTPPATSVPPASVAKPIPPPVSVSSGDIGLDASASGLRGALVNIICYAPPASGIHSISGSGVFIDTKGIILTNAHIAQHFLLNDRGVDCTIRTGSPARDTYKAALIYISPAWLRANATALTQAAPSGTGEYDFALLAVTRAVAGATLPASFPAVPLATLPVNIGTPIVIATYGAQFLEVNQIQSALSPTVVFGSVKDVFTFHTNTIDVLALGGSAAAQEGSSGGGVADASGELVGTITTSTVTGDTNTRSLSGITAFYIRGEYANETSNALDLLLAEPTATAVSDFAAQIPILEPILTAHLP